MAILRRRSEKIELLKEVTLFSTLPKTQLDAIARAADEVAVSAGDVLATQGQLGTAFYVIVKGEATVRRNGRKLSTLGPGDFFGEMSLLDREPRSATVTMDSDGAVLEVHRSRFGSLLDASPGLARALLTGLSQRLRDADAKLVS